MSSYISLNQVTPPPNTIPNAIPDGFKFSTDHSRVTPTFEGKKIKCQELRGKGKSIRVYTVDRYIKCNDKPIVVGIKKTACAIATFFRRLIGQTTKIKLGDKTVTVNLKSYFKYLVRVCSAVNASKNKNNEVTNTSANN
jgi:hypothetical protein